MEETQSFISVEDDSKLRCFECLPPSRGNMRTIARFGKVDVMLGPHWFMLLCTYAIVIGLSVVIYGVVLNEREEPERIVGLVLTILVIICLTMLGFADPGIAPISSEPVGDRDLSTFCDFCESYRQQGTIHCNDCNVCIEDYDHHCPWSSKCIGKKNVYWFHTFLGLLFVLMVYDAVETILVLSTED